MSAQTQKVAAWKEKLCFQTPTFIKHKVGGVEQKFYPISVGMLFELRRIGNSLMDALALFFADKSSDVKTTDKSIVTKEGDTDRTVTVEEASFEKIQYRDDQKARAWKKAFDTLAAEENKEVVGKIIMDSLREVFPREGFTGAWVGDVPNPTEFLNEMPLPMLTQFLIGVAKANADVIGPLGERAKSIFDLAEKKVMANLGSEVTVEAAK